MNSDVTEINNATKNAIKFFENNKNEYAEYASSSSLPAHWTAGFFLGKHSNFSLSEMDKINLPQLHASVRDLLAKQ